jgi:cell division septum initiation protein DivIVA
MKKGLTMAKSQEVQDLYEESSTRELSLCRVGFKDEADSRMRTKPGKRKTAHGGSVKVCPQEKRAFRNHDHAKEVLVRNKYMRNRLTAEGATVHRNESRRYFCATCRRVHLSSRADFRKEDAYAQGA